MDQSTDNTLEKLNSETARIGWGELARLFARGVVIVVADRLDLVSIAVSFTEDDKSRIEALMQSNDIRKATAEDAIRWNESNAEVWAVVVAPWVLVQEEKV